MVEIIITDKKQQKTEETPVKTLKHNLEDCLLRFLRTLGIHDQLSNIFLSAISKN